MVSEDLQARDLELCVLAEPTQFTAFLAQFFERPMALSTWNLISTSFVSLILLAVLVFI